MIEQVKNTNALKSDKYILKFSLPRSCLDEYYKFI